MSAVPAVSGNFGLAGQRVWRDMLAAVHPDLELDERDVLILTEACRQADLIDLLERAIAADGVVCAGAQGQPRVHGAVAQLVAARSLFTRLLGQVRLELEPAKTGHLSGPQRDRLRRLQRSA